MNRVMGYVPYANKPKHVHEARMVANDLGIRLSRSGLGVKERPDMPWWGLRHREVEHAILYAGPLVPYETNKLCTVCIGAGPTV